MMNEERRDDNHRIHQNDQTRERESDATSEETLSDLEGNEAEVETDNSHSSLGPSPDGAFDENDEIKDAGPM